MTVWYVVGFCRPACGTRGCTLIINLPGSNKGSEVRQSRSLYFFGTAAEKGGGGVKGRWGCESVYTGSK